MKICIAECFEGAPEQSVYVLDTQYIPADTNDRIQLIAELNDATNGGYVEFRYDDWDDIDLPDEAFPSPPCQIEKCVILYLNM